jgi:hypothetical protein
MTRRQRAFIAILAMPTVTVAGIALIRCGCTAAAYSIEFGSALIYLVFVMAVPRGR